MQVSLAEKRKRMLSKKEIAILNYLVVHQSQYVRSREIAEALKMSERTVRKYIGQLHESVDNNGAKIISKQGHGYKLEINFQVEFENFLKQYYSKPFDTHDTMNDANERQYYILNQLLFEQQWVMVDDMADKLFVSRSTINQDINGLKSDLQRYHLKIISKPAKGIAISGDERDKRHLIMDYFLGKGFYSTINKYFGNLMILNEINLEELSIIVLDETREAEILLSDYILQNLVLHLALAIKRIVDGNSIQNGGLEPVQNDQEEYIVAERILDRVGKVYDITFPDDEAVYIGLHILSKGSAKKETDADTALKEQVTNVLHTIEADFGYPMSTDLQLINGITTHIKPLLLRLKNDIQLENPLLEEIETNYRNYLELTKQYFKEMTSLEGHDITDSEWAYLTLHILAAIEKYDDRQKLNVLLICATGYGSAQMLKIRVEREFHLHLNIIDVISYYDIKNYDLSHIDVLISTIDLSTQLFKVPIIHVSVLLNEQDIAEINQFLHVKKEQTAAYSTTYYWNKHNEQVITRYFRPETFHYLDTRVTKDEVYNLLLDSMAVRESEGFKEQMLRQVRYREEFSSVVFSDDVAVPHPVQPIGDHSNIAVAIIPEGVIYDSEHRAIRVIFMLSPSRFEDHYMKDMVSLIVNLIDNKQMTERMIGVTNFEDFKDILLTAF